MEKVSTTTNKEDNPMLNNITLPNEQWKEIPNFDNYLVSNMGRVWSKSRETVMKAYKQNSGYMGIKLISDKKVITHFLIHRLVAIVWINNPDNKPFINHINGNKEDNTTSNLEWVTASENVLHARETGLNPYNFPTLNYKLTGKKKSASKYHGVFRDNSRNKWIGLVIHQRKNHCQKRFDSEIEAARHYDNVVTQMGLQHIKILNNV